MESIIRYHARSHEIEELYNIEQDPRELDNLALNPEHLVSSKS